MSECNHCETTYENAERELNLLNRQIEYLNSETSLQSQIIKELVGFVEKIKPMLDELEKLK